MRGVEIALLDVNLANWRKLLVKKRINIKYKSIVVSLTQDPLA